MSKPINSELLVEFNEELGTNRKNETLIQILEFLEMLRSEAQDEKIVRFSSDLTEILANEENFEKIQNTQNLEELLELVQTLSLKNKMLKIYSTESLRESFPNLAKSEFL
ncbi:hypothetical protein DMB92_06365 [Campylobacter sp. MIT 99-7217]|uniref:hypothetical protein n=1 Tax=Campylobacter sp. MIT 99-7217 TaxID=535091 RepID=UPI0011576BD3|nr:hypothetical protein [Campylobacter sp. MIT 99-7217]TQR31311.1 hypothetical protein DMB92_06365 [Campylobacter sp. MIT 99-7217]